MNFKNSIDYTFLNINEDRINITSDSDWKNYKF
jgi:hypothetical protein